MDLDLTNRAITEIAVDSIDDLLVPIGNLERESRVARNDQRRAGALAALFGSVAHGERAPRGHLIVSGRVSLRQIGADDRFPRRHDLGAVKAEFLEHRRRYFRHESADGLRETGLCRCDESGGNVRIWAVGCWSATGVSLAWQACGDVKDVYHCRCDSRFPRNRR